ncbi:uncharacterized protein LOC131664227 isoform X2 [Phymastichus coffea]|uniref:uncharacterized protein LOC131664227 isoform X2 n=1 Tax=Phymastichus coffea TaxID=108790 RepID=UPI00273BD468|nr:uncharacterized protein LOC131664227 isoform X2 [Phymastichus coffea]
MLKTKQMRNIFQPIEKKIIKLSELVNNNALERTDETITELKKSILDQLQTLSNKLDHISDENIDNYGELKINITSVIEDFCTINFGEKINVGAHHCNNQLFTAVIEQFLHVLQELEKFETCPFKHRLKECIKSVKDMGAAQKIEDLTNIKELGICITDIVKMLLPYQRNLISHLLSERLALYCNQLYASFSLLVLVVKEQYHICKPIHMCKKYVCERICICLESIINILDSSQPSEEEESDEIEQNFVFRLDMVLDMIKILSEKSAKEQVEYCKELWLGIEDVFTHAMSIAQICQPNSFNAITGSCQAVLTEYENLKRQLQSDPTDQIMNNLFINTLTDALYRLEQKINISVLTLVMEVFEDPFKKLKKLIQVCGTTLNERDRKKTDLSTVIEEFDQIVDKSVQIGKFAVACCRDGKKNAKIRNCLASFESLEMELIPATIAFYLHPTNQEMQSCVKLLTNQWQVEMNDFHHNINLIIDPAAYCQIILDDLQMRIDELSSCLDDHQDISQSQVKIIVQRALSLSKQVDATVEDLGQANINKYTAMIMREFKAAIYESDAALKKFLTRKATPSEQLRVIKRCDLMLKVIKRLLPALTTIINNSITRSSCTKEPAEKQENLNDSGIQLNFPSNINKLTLDENSMLYIRTPYSVKTCKKPITIQSANITPRNESDVSILVPYIRNGQLIRNEWSVMYKTPSKSKPNKQVLHTSVMRKNVLSFRQHLFSRDTILKNDSTDTTFFSFDLSSMLEGISNLSDTFS